MKLSGMVPSLKKAPDSPRQQGAVAASDALRVLETYAGLKPATLSCIRRQDPDLAGTESEKKFVRGYRRAVKAAAEGRVGDSFSQLDALGCIREREATALRDELAREYTAALARKEHVIAVTQTWDEVRALNACIRDHLKKAGWLGCQETPVIAWQTVDLTDMQKHDARFYPKASRICFVQNYGRFSRGDWADVRHVDASGIPENAASAGAQART